MDPLSVSRIPNFSLRRSGRFIPWNGHFFFNATMNEPTRRPIFNDTSAVVTLWKGSLAKRVDGVKQHYFPLTKGRKVSSYGFSATVRSSEIIQLPNAFFSEAAGTQFLLISPAKTYAAIIARRFPIPEHSEADAESSSRTTRP